TQMAVSDTRRYRVSEGPLHFGGCLRRAAARRPLTRPRHRREQARGERRKNRGPHGRTALAERELSDLILAAVTLKRVRRRAERNAIEVEAGARAQDRSAVARRICDADAWRHVVGVELNRIRQPLQVVPNAGVDRDIWSQPPVVLDEQPEVGI